MNRIGELYNKHKGETAIILGGGTTIYDDLKQVNGDVVIACNHHCLRMDFDYVVAMDSAIKGVLMADILREYKDKFISPYKHFGKYRIDLTARPHLGHFINTGILACFVAKQLGCEKVHLCGIEFYQGEKMYFDENKNVRESNKTPAYKNRCVDRLLQIGIDIGFNRVGVN